MLRFGRAYSLLQPELAGRLREQKLDALRATGADQIVTANIGCMLHLQTKAAVPVRHWIELLDERLVRTCYDCGSCRFHAMSLKIDTCAARHRGDRAEQQDRVGIFVHPRHPQLILAVLADGMGGFAGGAHAAEQVLQHAREAFETHVPKRESARALLARLVESAHLAVRLSRFTNGVKPRSTVAALLWQPQRVDWVHCGDSRIYHYRGDHLVGRSEDHSVVAQRVSEGRMASSDASTHPKRHVLHSSLGGDRMPQMSFSGIRGTHSGEYFLLCSDGLWAHVDDVEMGRILHAMPARQAAQQLIERARERGQGEGDNVSLAVLRCVGTGPGATQTGSRAG